MLRGRRRTAAPRYRLIALLLAGAGLLGGCTSFSDGYARIDRQLASGNVAAALAGHEQLAYPPRDRALRALNRAMLLRLNGDLAGANAALESAKLTMDELSRLSLVEQASSLVTNDEFRAYEGQVHERIYLHLIKAINFLQLGERYAARVEVLQLDVLMRELSGNEARKVERAAPFARYLSGLIYDALDEPSDAMIAYRQALLAYRARDGAAAVPRSLQRDLLRLSQRLGLSEELEDYRQQFGAPAPDEAAAEGEGELVAIVFDGLAPPLRENSVLWPTLGGRMIRISLPAVEPRRMASPQPQLNLSGQRVSGELVDSIDQLVRDDLDDRLPAMAARLVARQALKQGAATAAGKAAQRKADNSGQSGDQAAAGLLAIGLQFAAVLSERADTRSWATLPGKIWLIRQPLPAGEHPIRLQSGGRTQAFPGVRIAPGEKTFVVWHPLGPGVQPASVQ